MAESAARTPATQVAVHTSNVSSFLTGNKVAPVFKRAAAGDAAHADVAGDGGTPNAFCVLVNAAGDVELAAVLLLLFFPRRRPPFATLLSIGD